MNRYPLNGATVLVTGGAGLIGSHIVDQLIDEGVGEIRVLDNLRNERPDWREYWPIRRFLLEGTPDPDAFYGFFSPRFSRYLAYRA